MSSQDDYPSRPPAHTGVLATTRVLDGKYRLGRLIGEGGMGAVYEAEHAGLRARVAVKLLGEHGALDPKSVARFRREARAMGAIRHENVVQVMDTGSDEEGSPYLVMELLEGENLGAVLRRERTLAPGLACWIADQVLGGLEAAHAQGVVHRDLKPGNIFLARRPDGNHRVKILDFGISKLGDGGNTLELTAEGAMIGTPSFMAPEAISGEAPSDTRVDLYAVGVLLYRMVTGRLPYTSSNMEEMYRMVLLGLVTPPRQLNANIPPELEAVILRGMAADRNQRYPDASTFRAALREVAALVPGELPTATHGLPAPPMPTGPMKAMTAPTGPTGPTGHPHHYWTSSGTMPAGPSALRRQDRQRTVMWFALGGLLIFALAAAGTVWLTRGQAGGGSDGATLRFGVVQSASAEEVAALHRPVLDHLSRRLARSVELVLAVDEADLLERFFEGGVHLAALSPYTYVQAERRGTPGIRLIAKPVTASGPLQKGVILTRNNSGIRNLGSLVSKRFCFVSPGSTSGYLYPRALLRQAGLDPDYSFSSTSFGQEHLNTLRLLDRGVCDAAAMSAGAVKAGEKAGMSPDRFHQLAATEPIPYDAYAVLATMPSDETQAITAALLALEPGSAVARSVLSGGKSDITGFTRATDSDYDPVRRIERFLSGDEEAR